MLFYVAGLRNIYHIQLQFDISSTDCCCCCFVFCSFLPI